MPFGRLAGRVRPRVWSCTSTSAGRVTFNVFGALAEFERDVIRDRTRAASRPHAQEEEEAGVLGS